MTFKKWMQLNKIKNKDAAELVGVSPGSISSYKNGDRTPSSPVIKRIFAITNGQVPPSAWY